MLMNPARRYIFHPADLVVCSFFIGCGAMVDLSLDGCASYMTHSEIQQYPNIASQPWPSDRRIEAERQALKSLLSAFEVDATARLRVITWNQKMFSVHESTHRGGGELLGDGYHNFRIAEWNLTRHWYHVVVREGSGESAWTKVLMLGDVAELEEIVSPRNDYELLDVQIMAPPWMNGTKGWSLERVTSVVVGHDSQGIQITQHHIEDQKSYSDVPGRLIDVGSTKGLRKLF